MSVSLTEDAVVSMIKTETRRLGWKFAKVGDTLTLCRKVMGRKKGEPLIRLAEVEIVGKRTEKLCDITEHDVVAEGLAPMTPYDFVEFFCATHKGATPYTPITVIQWKYLLMPCHRCHNQFDGKMPGYAYGSNWDWVDCQTCRGAGWESVA